MSEGQCNTGRVSTLYTSTLQVARSTPFTDARQSASARGVRGIGLLQVVLGGTFFLDVPWLQLRCLGVGLILSVGFSRTSLSVLPFWLHGGQLRCFGPFPSPLCGPLLGLRLWTRLGILSRLWFGTSGRSMINLLSSFLLVTLLQFVMP